MNKLFYVSMITTIMIAVGYFFFLLILSARWNLADGPESGFVFIIVYPTSTMIMHDVKKGWLKKMMTKEAEG